MSNPEFQPVSANAPSQQITSEGGMSAAPPAFSLTAAPAQLQPDPAVAQLQDGHDPGQDYTSGKMREKSYLRLADLATRQTEAGQRIYFRAGDTVNLVGPAANHWQWIEVSGTAYSVVGGAETAVGVRTGFIHRDWTDMTRGNYDGLHVDDRTEDYGDLGLEQENDVDEVILHQTMTRTGTSTLDIYDDRIAANSSIGAQYLIDENGGIILVVPANEVVSHVRGNKHKNLTRPTAVAGTPDWTTQMATVRQQIEDYYTELTVKSIPADQRDKLLAMSDQDLFTLLAGQNWRIYSSVSNSSAVGIEVVGYPERMYTANPGFNEANMTAIRTTLEGYSLAPELKRQLLKPDERAAIQANASLTEPEKQTQLTALDRELYDILSTNSWYIYTDLSPEQKYASWMLVQALCADFGLSVDQDVLAHNQTDSKTLGEGENNMEFIRTMSEFQQQITVLEGLVAKYGIRLEGELAFLAEFRAAVTSMRSGEKLQAGDAGYTDMISFMREFWTNNQRLTETMQVLQTADSLNVTDLISRAHTARAGTQPADRLNAALFNAILGGIEMSVNVTVNSVAGPIDTIMGNPDTVTVKVRSAGGTFESPAVSMAAGASNVFSIPMAGVLPVTPGEQLNIQVLDAGSEICQVLWTPAQGAVTDFSKAYTLADYSASVTIRR
jgi:hypothetical protein